MATRAFSSARSLLSIVFVLTAGLPCVRAQTSRTLPVGPALGATVDRFNYEGYTITALSFRFSDLRPRQLNTELGVSLFPDALETGAIYLAPDIGAAFKVSGPGVAVLLKGGLSALTALGRSFSLLPGYHIGAGVILQATKGVGVRLDLARHTYLEGAQVSEPLWSVGVGFTSLGRRIRPVELPPAPTIEQ